MVRKDRCCVGICNNDRSYPDKLEIKSHVQILKWHRFPKDKAKRKWWQTLVNKGRENFVASDESRICSNHFVDGKPTEKTPQPNIITDYPGQQAVGFSLLRLCFISDQKTLPVISHTHQSIESISPYSRVHQPNSSAILIRLFHFTSFLFLLAFLYA